jgi:Tfp pilus assembly protein PilN
MITLNLLPDIKKEYLRSQRIKRLFIVGAVIVSGAFVALAVLLAIFVFGAQRLHLSSIQSDIDEAVTTLQNQPDLDKIVTIQKQLEALPQLHAEKPAADRLLEYLSKLVPQDISLTRLQMTLFEDYEATLTGFGSEPKAVNVFVDTLKNATFTHSGDQTVNPFSQVVLDGITVDENEGTSYRIILTFDPILFDNTVTDGELNVPNITTSASVQGRPDIFQEPSEEEQQ